MHRKGEWRGGVSPPRSLRTGRSRLIRLPGALEVGCIPNLSCAGPRREIKVIILYVTNTTQLREEQKMMAISSFTNPPFSPFAAARKLKTIQSRRLRSAQPDSTLSWFAYRCAWGNRDGRRHSVAPVPSPLAMPLGRKHRTGWQHGPRGAARPLTRKSYFGAPRLTTGYFVQNAIFLPNQLCIPGLLISEYV
jgi:hypothetical protein